MTAKEPQTTAAVLARFLIAVLVIAAPGRGQSAERPTSVSPADAQATQSAPDSVHHYGILGSVGRPGVYACVHDDLTLAELVAAAGGTTSQAAGSAQVIRRGHTGPRLNCSPPSTAGLKPGDVVVVERSSAAGAQQSDEWIPVALVGIVPDEPIVVMLPSSLAEVPQLIAALQQQPVLIETVRILRPSVGRPRNAGAQPGTRLVDGDIVVFDPTTLDHRALARAESFPPPVLIPERDRREDLKITIRPQQPFAGESVETVPIAATSAAESPAAGDELPEEVWPLRHKRSKESEHAVLQPLALPESSPTPLAAEDHPLAEENDIVSVEGVNEEEEEPAAIRRPQQIVAASLAETQPESPPREDQTAVGRAAREPERMTAPQSDTVMTLAGNGPQRPALRTAATDVTGGITQVVARSAEIPAPSDPADGRGAPGLGRRAMTVGITVLATALMCFAASLLWSRLDDSTGLTGVVVGQSEEQLPIHSRAAQRDTLNRLINNELPIIEEPTLLPDKAGFHGEAVGRRRLRIDAEQSLSGPHFAAPQQTPQPVAVPKTAGAANTRPNREDPSAETPSGEVAASANRGTTQGGLLDRVLVAMERERRR